LSIALSSGRYFADWSRPLDVDDAVALVDTGVGGALVTGAELLTGASLVTGTSLVTGASVVTGTSLVAGAELTGAVATGLAAGLTWPAPSTTELHETAPPTTATAARTAKTPLITVSRTAHLSRSTGWLNAV